MSRDRGGTIPHTNQLCYMTRLLREIKKDLAELKAEKKPKPKKHGEK